MTTQPHPPELHAGPLYLRQLALTDQPAIFRLSQESGMREWLPDQVYADEAEALQVLEYLMSHYASPDAPRQSPYVLGVCVTASRELIGHVGFSPWSLGVEIGYAIGEAHQNRGYARMAIEAATSWALRAFGLAAVHAVVAQDNVPSWKVLEACEFQLVEVQRRKLHGTDRMVRIYRRT